MAHDIEKAVAEDLEEHVGHETPTVKGSRAPAESGPGSGAGGEGSGGDGSGVDADGFRDPDDDCHRMLGQTVSGRYRLVDKIGQGGMGEVYLGLNDQLGQRVAVKFLSRRFADDASIVSRFLNEARSYCRVNHPNAVTLLDYGQHADGTLYIITEFIEGKNLTETLKEVGPLPVELVLATGIQLCEVLSAAHQQGVIHRDLKPDNLMLMPGSRGRYQVKVLDFGIAKIVDEEEDAPTTETGSVFGTPEFMSPEQSRGDTADPRSDIYAVGIILFYMLTGKLPFRGKNKLVVLNKQLNEAPPRPSKVRDDVEVPPRLEAVIMKCLNKAREARYPSADDLLEALEELQQPAGASTARLGAHAKAAAPALKKKKGAGARSDGLKEIRHPTLRFGDGGGAHRPSTGGDGPDELGEAASLDVHGDTLEAEFRGGPAHAELESVEMWREHPSDRMVLPRSRRASRAPWILAGVAGLALAAGGLWLASGGEESAPPPEIEHVLVTGQVMGTLAAVEAMLADGSLDAAGRSLDLTRLWLADEQMAPAEQGRRSGLEASLRRLVALRADVTSALERGQCARARTLHAEMAGLSVGLADRFEQPVEACGEGARREPAPRPAPKPVAAPKPAPRPAPKPVAAPKPDPKPLEPVKPVDVPEPKPAPKPEPVAPPEPKPAPAEEPKTETPAAEEAPAEPKGDALPDGMALPPKIVE